MEDFTPAGGITSSAGFVLRRRGGFLMTHTPAVRMCLHIHRFIFPALVVFIVLATNMCQAESRKSTIPGGEKEGGADLRTFTDQDSPKEFRLRLGEEFQVQLPENPTTGFLWTVLESSSPNIELEREEFLLSEDPRIVGAGGMRVVVFKAAKPGRAVLHLGLKRPWEKEGKCSGTYTLNLVVE
jgi:predicted secreted protein